MHQLPGLPCTSSALVTPAVWMPRAASHLSPHLTLYLIQPLGSQLGGPLIALNPGCRGVWRRVCLPAQVLLIYWDF